MLWCPACQAGAPPGKKFCRGCGGPLEEKAAPGQCPSCSQTVSPQAKFCRHCGFQLSIPPAHKAEPTNESRDIAALLRRAQDSRDAGDAPIARTILEQAITLLDLDHLEPWPAVAAALESGDHELRAAFEARVDEAAHRVPWGPARRDITGLYAQLQRPEKYNASLLAEITGLQPGHPAHEYALIARRLPARQPELRNAFAAALGAARFEPTQHPAALHELRAFPAEILAVLSRHHETTRSLTSLALKLWAMTNCGLAGADLEIDATLRPVPFSAREKLADGFTHARHWLTAHRELFDPGGQIEQRLASALQRRCFDWVPDLQALFRQQAVEDQRAALAGWAAAIAAWAWLTSLLLPEVWRAAGLAALTVAGFTGFACLFQVSRRWAQARAFEEAKQSEWNAWQEALGSELPALDYAVTPRPTPRNPSQTRAMLVLAATVASAAALVHRQFSAASPDSTPVSLNGRWDGRFDCQGRPHSIVLQFNDAALQVDVPGIGAAVYDVAYPTDAAFRATPVREIRRVRPTRWLIIEGTASDMRLTGKVEGCGPLQATRHAAPLTLDVVNPATSLDLLARAYPDASREPSSEPPLDWTAFAARELPGHSVDFLAGAPEYRVAGAIDEHERDYTQSVLLDEPRFSDARRLRWRAWDLPPVPGRMLALAHYTFPAIQPPSCCSHFARLFVFEGARQSHTGPSLIHRGRAITNLRLLDLDADGAPEILLEVEGSAAGSAAVRLAVFAVGPQLEFHRWLSAETSFIGEESSFVRHLDAAATRLDRAEQFWFDKRWLRGPSRLVEREGIPRLSSTNSVTGTLDLRRWGSLPAGFG